MSRLSLPSREYKAESALARRLSHHPLAMAGTLVVRSLYPFFQDADTGTNLDEPGMTPSWEDSQ